MDAVYLWGGTRRSPAHVVALQIFRPPAGAGPELLDGLYRAMTDPAAVKPAFRRRPYRSPATAGQYAWATDSSLDLRQHVRRVALPRPGRTAELMDHVADFHAVPLDRDRPLWQAHLVEGLAGDRFALCTKLHHALFDGVNMGRHVLGGLSPDAAARGGTAPWIQRSSRRRAPAARAASTAGNGVLDGVSRLGGAVGGTVKALAGGGVAAVREGPPTVPFSAPRTIFNGRVGTARRFAGESWPTDRLREVARWAGTSVNDVALALCGGALRSYLAERGQLPAAPLVAMVPIALGSTDPSAEARDGNSWAAVLCNLATDTPDGLDRLRRVHTSMRRSKRLMSELDPVTAAALSAGVLGGALLSMVPGPRPPPAFNLVISNVPAARRTLYLDGCELTDNYPVSVVTDGQALNITLISYVDRIAFGISGCRRSVPELERIPVHLDAALRELELGKTADSA
jgi:diacylglycerol O-acyltransferase